MADYSLTLPEKLLPVSAIFNGEPLIISHNIIPAAVSAPVKSYANTISGSFSYDGAPCSILAAWGDVIRAEACHAHIGKPETVIYRLSNSALGIRRVKSAAELPPSVSWAVGGMGLLDFYDPSAEGFTGQYADVCRKTAHTFLGLNDSLCVLGYVAAMNGEEINAHVRKLGLRVAIMLDGGHMAAINCPAATKNLYQKQSYIIQGV